MRRISLVSLTLFYSSSSPQRNGGTIAAAFSGTAAITSMIQPDALASAGTAVVATSSLASGIGTTFDDWVRSYQYAAENEGLVTDMLTCGSINTASDAIAQLFSNAKKAKASLKEDDQQQQQQQQLSPNGSFDAARTLRLATFGVVDGAVSHAWFIGLDLVVGDGYGFWTETLIKTASDALVYTPLWCVWFLAAVTTLDAAFPSPPTSGKTSFQNLFRSIPSVVKSDWLELFKGNLGFFLPLTGLIYGYVPREERVLAFGCASLVYTTILSLWNQSRSSATNELMEDFELCDIVYDDEDDPECVPIARPSRAVLPFGVRRVVVQARRSFRS